VDVKIYPDGMEKRLPYICVDCRRTLHPPISSDDVTEVRKEK